MTGSVQQQLRRGPIKSLVWVALFAVLALLVIRYVASNWGTRVVPVEYLGRVYCGPGEQFVLVAKDSSGAVVGRSTIPGHIPVNTSFCLARGTMALHSGGPITVSLARAASPDRVMWTHSYSDAQVGDDDFAISAGP